MLFSSSTFLLALAALSTSITAQPAATSVASTAIAVTTTAKPAQPTILSHKESRQCATRVCHEGMDEGGHCNAEVRFEMDCEGRKKEIQASRQLLVGQALTVYCGCDAPTTMKSWYLDGQHP
ncbi:unnamed protein product [Periconia digitata]|uniref:Ig-like domain-containing protein n=1 Tax=Periconia digitata TaxID=1303443 RepID=A0A9W4UKT7_9PLEO|nr:unnamed protein product [Periconia digitata]